MFNKKAGTTLHNTGASAREYFKPSKNDPDDSLIVAAEIRPRLSVANRAVNELPANASDVAPRRWSYQVFQTTVGMGVFQVLAFVTGILIARGLGAERLGRFQLLMSVTTFVIMLAKLGLDEGVAYLIPRYEAERPSKVFSLIAYSLGVSFIVSVAFGCFCYFAASYLERHVFKLPGFAADLKFALWLMPAMMLLMMSLAVLRGLGRSDHRAYVYYYAVGLSFLIAVIVFSISGLSATGAYVARTVSFVLGAFLALALIFRAVGRDSLTIAATEIKSLHSFASLLVLVGLFQYVVGQPLVDLVIVGRYASAGEVGIYSVAARVGSLVAIIANALTIVMAPALAGSAAQKDSGRLIAQYLRASEWMARLSVFAAVALLLLRKESLALFGGAYQSGENLLIVFLVGQAIVGLMGLNTPLLLASGHAWVEFLITGIFAVVMIASGVILGKLYGPAGVAVATAASAVLLAVARRAACAFLFEINQSRQMLEVLILGVLALAVGLAVRQAMPGSGLLQTSLTAFALTAAFWGLSFAFRERLGFLWGER